MVSRECERERRIVVEWKTFEAGDFANLRFPNIFHKRQNDVGGDTIVLSMNVFTEKKASKSEEVQVLSPRSSKKSVSSSRVSSASR
jgi:hypothetical protein